MVEPLWTWDQHSYMSDHEEEISAACLDDEATAAIMQSVEYQELFGDMDFFTLLGRWDDWND